MNIEFWQKQLKEYDELEEIAHSLYSKLLKWNKSPQEVCDKAFLLCDTIQGMRFTCQHHIIHLQMGKSHDEVIEDYNEYPYRGSADNQSDEMDALASIGWAEDEYY